jgi:hypothetical protein
LTARVVRPGQVEGRGLKQEAWRYCMRLLLVLVCCAAFSKWDGYRGGRCNGRGLGQSGRSQSFVAGSRGPSRMVLLCCWTRQLLTSKITVQPLLHSLAMDRSECEASPGRRCPSRALEGKALTSKSQVWAEARPPPFGIWTLMGCVAICALTWGLCGFK